MAQRSQSQARTQPALETKNKTTDVVNNSKSSKPSPSDNGGGGNNASFGGGKRRDFNKNKSSRQQRGGGGGGAYGGPAVEVSSSYGGRHNRGYQGGAGGRRGGEHKGGKNAAVSQANRFPGAVTEADEIEIGSVFKSGSKKQNFNHLLKFKSYESQRGTNDRDRGHDRRGPRQGRWQGKSRHVPVVTYTREQYLAANCQFLVKASGDYDVQVVDPDIPVAWENIEEVKLFTPGSEPLNCPICLFPPRPGKIGRCGHVFCWPCILHYLALSDDSYRKCPICEDKIYKEDLKSVRLISQETYSTGSTIELRLMKRERNSLFAVPVAHAGLEHVPSVEDSFLDRSLSKLVKATPQQVMELVLDRERRQLDAIFAEEKDTPESIFITEAIKLLEGKVESCIFESVALASHQALPSLVELPQTQPKQNLDDQATEIKIITSSVKVLDPFADENKDEKPLEEIFSPVSDVSTISDYVTSPETEKSVTSPEEEGFARPRHVSSGSSIGSEHEGEVYGETTVTADDLDISNVQNVPSGQSSDNPTADNRPKALMNPKDVFYFYQEVNGQRIFMHALNINMLVHEYGTLEACPPTITAKILEMDSSTMSENLRQRLRYLRHLPLSCSFEVAELDLNGLLSRKTIAHFKDQLTERRRRRQRKMTAEQRREKKIRLEEMRIMNRFPSPMARIQSDFHYPRMDDEPIFNNSDPDLQASAVPTEEAPEPSSSGLNFASIARKGKPQQKVQQPQTVVAVGGGSSGMIRLGGVLPRARVVVRPDSDSEPEPEGYVPVPKTSTLGASLAQALAQVGQSGGGNQADTAGGKKKKGRRARGIPVQL